MELHRVESTNNYAMGMVRAAMAHHGMAVFAREQTKGKGQREKEWISEPGSNIALSMVIEPEIAETARAFLLSMSAALAVLDLVSEYITDGLSIKWPNDLYWNDRKAAGILIENLWQGTEWKFAVVGVGINVNQTEFGPLTGKAVSIKQVTGRSNDTLQMARRLCEKMDKRLALLQSDAGAIISAYNSHLYRLHSVARFRKGNRVFDARVSHVEAGGQLVLHHGVEERFAVGEIEWVI